MKKVGLLISQLNKGGAERVVSRLTNILSSKYDVYLIVFEDTYMEYPYHANLVNLDIKSSGGILKKGVLLYKRIKKLKKVKKDYNLDIVISYLDSPNIINILSKINKCKVAVSIRNFSFYENNNSILGKLTNYGIKIFYNQADYVIPVTQIIAHNYNKQYKIKNEKMKVIYNPYDIDEIVRLGNENISAPDNEFFSEGKTFISVGRHMHQKGFWHLIKAFNIVQKQYTDAKLIIVGQDHCNGKVGKLVKELDLEQSILITGQVDNPFKYMKNSDVYILSSLFEGFPNSMVEAMACGCSIIATDCKSGPREILYKNPQLNSSCEGIEQADYGILVTEFNQDENWCANVISDEEHNLAKAMIMLIKDENLRIHYSDKAQERVADFNYIKCMNDYSAIID